MMKITTLIFILALSSSSLAVLAQQGQKTRLTRGSRGIKDRNNNDHDGKMVSRGRRHLDHAGIGKGKGGSKGSSCVGDTAAAATAIATKFLNDFGAGIAESCDGGEDELEKLIDKFYDEDVQAILGIPALDPIDGADALKDIFVGPTASRCADTSFSYVPSEAATFDADANTITWVGNQVQIPFVDPTPIFPGTGNEIVIQFDDKCKPKIVASELLATQEVDGQCPPPP